MANTLLTIDMVTNEALRVLHGNLAFVKNVNRDYDDQFARDGAKIGDVLRIRKPPKYTVRTGRAMQVQNSTEAYVNLPVSNQKGVDMEWTSAEFTMSVDNFSDRFLKPSMSVLAATIDYLFAFDATSELVDDHQYALLTDAYLLDKHTRDFIQQHNPGALQDILERLLEAQQRGLWQHPGEYREALENLLIDSEES